MSQLIALIIAIALGAIVTAIGYVFLGDAFTSNSERGVALQLVNQASQLEMAMTAYRAAEAAPAFDTVNNTFALVNTLLTDEGYLKDGLVAPQGAFDLVENNGDVFLVVDDATANGISQAVCAELANLSGIVPTTDADSDNIGEATVTVGAATGAQVDTVLDGARYNCVEDVGAATGYVFAYQVD